MQIGAVSILLILAAFVLPLPRAIRHPQDRAPVTVVDRRGEVLYESRDKNFGSQKAITLGELHPLIVPALIATEDRSFYSHMGVSIRGITRAAFQNIQSGEIVSGGSTITQQLVRIRLEPKRRSWLYKLREAWLALKLDMRLSKQEILTQYLGSVYFGHQAYGIESAAHTYFGKELRELSTGEIALLIGVIQNPVGLDPFQYPSNALKRRTLVLRAMLDAGVITQEDFDQADAEKLHLAQDTINIKAPHFVFWTLARYPDRATPGAFLNTTLDYDLQSQVEAIVSRRILDLAEKNVTSAAVVVLDAKTGELLSMVGSADYFDTAHDGAVNAAVAARQPGSSLKPFTYALAMVQGDTPATTVADIFVQLFTEDGNPYTPRNYDYDFHGLVRYREALANSYNIAAVKTLEKVGVSQLIGLLRAAGVTTLTRDPEFYGLALTLGSGEVQLLELARAYGIFPRLGITLPLKVLQDEKVEVGNKVLDERVAWLISDILSDNDARLPEFGENTPLSVPPYKVAAKTGTTRNARDNWVIGYTPERIVGVWVGNANNSPMRGTSGVTGAGPIFHDVMEVAMNGLPISSFARPAGITEGTICRLSGKLPTSECPQTLHEYFVEGTEPKDQDTIYQEHAIDVRNGLLAGEDCPPQFVQKRIFTLFPPEVRPWARDNGYLEPPFTASPLCNAGAESSEASSVEDVLVIMQPQPGDSILLDPLVPDEYENMIFEARAARSVTTIEWFVDGVSLGTADAPDFRKLWKPEPGMHRVEARQGTEKVTVNIEVVKPDVGF